MDPAVTAAGVRDVPLHIDVDAFRALGHALVDRVAAHYATLPERPVVSDATVSEIRALIDADASLPEHGTEAREALLETANTLFDHSLFNAHPRFFGYITSPPAPIGVLGDFLAAAVNANVGAAILSPVATQIERQTVRWTAQLLGYPDTCGGILVSGGNMANFVGFWAARTAAAGWNVREHGLHGYDARPLRVYASAETHTWIQKAADLSGLGTSAIRWIPVGADQRMDVDALHRTIDTDRSRGDIPMLVVATAGSVSTGAVDPIARLADVCAETGTWLHVDGAYGGYAAAVPSEAHRFAGLERAQSVAVDPHKWLYSPLEAGCALVRDPELLRNAFSYHPAYYHFGDHLLNFVEYGPQNSRGFRALKVWLALRQTGRAGAIRMIEDDIRLSRRMFAACAAHAEIEALTQDLSIATFRYVPAEWADRVGEAETEEKLNALNRRVQERIEVSGDLFVSNALVDGRYALRACIVNFNTTAADVDAVPDLVARHGRAVLSGG